LWRISFGIASLPTLEQRERERDRGLIGERLGELDLVRGEDAPFVRDDDCDEADLAAPAQRHAEQRCGIEALDEVLADRRIAGRIGHRHRRAGGDDA
jgi:hypothetical protein